MRHPILGIRGAKPRIAPSRRQMLAEEAAEAAKKREKRKRKGRRG
jgi:hypothetical protein